MRLNRGELASREQWVRGGFSLPEFDLAETARLTHTRPEWIHFGAGNIFRAYLATLQQRLLDRGLVRTGLIVAEGFDYEIIDRVFSPHDNLSVSVVLRADGSIEKSVVASVVEALKMDAAHPDFSRLEEIFRSPTLRMATFTITEKGYSLAGADGRPTPEAAEDFRSGPARPESYVGKLAALVHERYRAGAAPLALVSMDNYSRNGERLAEAVRSVAREWAAAGLVDPGFSDYVGGGGKISFPCTMIDKITPRPDPGIARLLAADGFADTEISVTGKNSHVAPFVNAEQAGYLVVEDSFPNGRPTGLAEAGVIFTDLATVDRVERMKVGSCLNSLHLSMAIFGCLLSIDRINAATRDPEIEKLIHRLGYGEGLPVAVNPGIIDPRAFLDEVITQRLPNPFIPDTPQRIVVDCSQKFSTRFGETIKAHAADPRLGAKNLLAIPLTIAGWCRYLLEVDDSGNRFAASPDPRFAELAAHLRGVRIGDRGGFHDQLFPVLADAGMFGVDLYATGLGDRIERYFAEMVAGRGAVRETLRRHLSA